MDGSTSLARSGALIVGVVSWMVLIHLSQPVQGYIVGAPEDVCGNFSVIHGNKVAQSSSSPYTITIKTPDGSTDYPPGGTVEVKITGDRYKGIMMQAQVVGTTDPVGWFVLLFSGIKGMKCTEGSNRKTVVTQTTDEWKDEIIIYTWYADASQTGDIEFVATIVKSYEKFWEGVTSSSLSAGTPIVGSGDWKTPVNIALICIGAIVLAGIIATVIYFLLQVDV